MTIFLWEYDFVDFETLLSLEFPTTQQDAAWFIQTDQDERGRRSCRACASTTGSQPHRYLVYFIMYVQSFIQQSQVLSTQIHSDKAASHELECHSCFLPYSLRIRPQSRIFIQRSSLDHNHLYCHEDLNYWHSKWNFDKIWWLQKTFWWVVFTCRVDLLDRT